MKRTFPPRFASLAILGFSLFAERVYAQTPAEPPPATPLSPTTSQPPPASTASSSGTAPAPGDPAPGDPAPGDPAPGGLENLTPPSEERTANNSIFLELLGNGGLYSVNYERIFGDSNFSLRAGFSYFSLSAGDSSTSLITIPLLVNYYIGGLDHKLQLGAGALGAYVSASTTSTGTGYLSGSGVGVAGTAVVGYRYIPHDGGFNFGVGFTPIVGAGGFAPFGGISFGGGF